jgi:DNA-binding IclR family transcriptional regulator
VEKNEATGHYAIGGQVPELALARKSRSPLLAAAEPYLTRVSAQVGDTLFLTVRTGLDTMCVARRIGTYPIQVLPIEVGARRPLGVSSASIAILAALPAQQARGIVADNHVRFRGYRTTVARALEQIALTRRRGYCLHHTGLVHGTKAISTTIRALDGQPAAAITIAAVRSRLGPRREDEIVEILKLASTAIEQALHRQPQPRAVVNQLRDGRRRGRDRSPLLHRDGSGSGDTRSHHRDGAKVSFSYTIACRKVA